MTWFKVDDGFPRHGKVKALRRFGARVRADAIALWMLSGCECAAALREGGVVDGHVSVEDVEAILTPTKPHAARAAADALVSVGLWHAADDGGYLFHDWSEYQPSASSVKKERDRWRESKHKSRGRPANVPPGQAGDSRPRPETPVPVPVPSSFGGEPELLDRDRPTTANGEIVRRIVASGFAHRGLPTPRECARLGVEPWNTLGAWCAEAAEIEGASVNHVATSLLEGFLSNARAKTSGYPMAYLAANPLEYRPMRAAAAPAEPVDFDAERERVRLANESRRKARSGT